MTELLQRFNSGKFWSIQHRRDGSRKQYAREMTAHSAGGLLVVLGIEFITKSPAHFRY